jgi:hypothetical protein
MYDHVDGVRLRLRTAATNGRTVYPQVIYDYGESLWNDIDRGKLLIRPPEPSGNTIGKFEVSLFILIRGPGRLLPSDLAPILQYGSRPKLITSREVFCNVNQVAFPAEVRTEKCECSKQASIR